MSRFISWLGSLAAELKHRRIYHVASAYAVAAWVVLQVVKLLVDALFLPQVALTLALALVLLGFPLAMVLTWAYDITPAGVERTSQLDPDAAPRGVRRGAVAVLFAVMVLTTAGAGWAAWRVWLDPTRNAAAAATSQEDEASPAAELVPTRIAVLYFDDLSPDQDLTYVAHGLTEALTHELSQVDALDVVPRTAVKPFRDSEAGLDSIARALRAGSIVEGSVERSGDLLRATVQLVDGRTATHLMSRQVERSGDDLLALRDEIVQEAARLLRHNLGEEVRLERTRAGTEDQRAWETFHRAQRTRDDAQSLLSETDTALARRLFHRADSLLARAESLDPEWIEPIIARGEIAMEMARPTPSVEDLDTLALREASEHAARALRRNAGDPQALYLRGESRYWLAMATQSGQRLQASEEDLRAAVDEDPSLAMAWARLASVLWRQGEFEEAKWAVSNAREVDHWIQLDPNLAWQAATLAFETGDLEEALDVAKEAVEEYPEHVSLHSVYLNVLASTARSEEDVTEAWRALRKIDEGFAGGVYWNGRLRVAAALARTGSRDSALALLHRVEAREEATNEWTDYYAAYTMLQLGEEEEALRRLERFAAAATPQERESLAREWRWRPLRDDPRFRALVSGSDREGN